MLSGDSSGVEGKQGIPQLWAPTRHLLAWVSPPCMHSKLNHFSGNLIWQISLLLICKQHVLYLHSATGANAKMKFDNLVSTSVYYYLSGSGQAVFFCIYAPFRQMGTSPSINTVRKFNLLTFESKIILNPSVKAPENLPLWRFWAALHFLALSTIGYELVQTSQEPPLVCHSQHNDKIYRAWSCQLYTTEALFQPLHHVGEERRRKWGRLPGKILSQRSDYSWNLHYWAGPGKVTQIPPSRLHKWSALLGPAKHC